MVLRGCFCKVCIGGCHGLTRSEIWRKCQEQVVVGRLLGGTIVLSGEGFVGVRELRLTVNESGCGGGYVFLHVGFREMVLGTWEH